MESQAVDYEQVDKLRKAIEEFGINLQIVAEDKYVGFYSKYHSVIRLSGN